MNSNKINAIKHTQIDKIAYTCRIECRMTNQVDSQLVHLLFCIVNLHINEVVINVWIPILRNISSMTFFINAKNANRDHRQFDGSLLILNTNGHTQTYTNNILFTISCTKGYYPDFVDFTIFTQSILKHLRNDWMILYCLTFLSRIYNRDEWLQYTLWSVTVHTLTYFSIFHIYIYFHFGRNSQPWQ